VIVWKPNSKTNDPTNVAVRSLRPENARNLSRPEAGRELASGSVKINDGKEKIVLKKHKLGEIPDDHFENEPTFPAKNVTPLSKEIVEWVEKLKADKYQPGDIVGGY